MMIGGGSNDLRRLSNMMSRFSCTTKAIWFIMVGAACNALGTLAERFLPQMPGIDFTSGLMTGMSITLMLFGMWRFGVERRQAAK